jgi:hypothetical protein
VAAPKTQTRGRIGPNALHAGDNITVKFIPVRDGTPLGFLKTAIMPDGRATRADFGAPYSFSLTVLRKV